MDTRQDKVTELTANMGSPDGVDPSVYDELVADTQPGSKIPEPLTMVRSLGFDNVYQAKGSTETLFFIGPTGEQSLEATDEAIEEFRQYLRHTLETVDLYLANHKNNRVNEWATKPSESA